MLNLIKKKSGFTLLEIIFSLVILSILVAIAGLGIVAGSKGYLFARQNAHSAQKAQMALARMTREFRELDEITACSTTSVSFKNSVGNFTIGLSGNNIRIKTGNGNLATGDILIDEIAPDGFILDFSKGDGEWFLTDPQADLIDIKIQIEMIRNDLSSENLPFSTSVHPRNL